jgi:hypothetical protein
MMIWFQYAKDVTQTEPSLFVLDVATNGTAAENARSKLGKIIPRFALDSEFQQ